MPQVLNNQCGEICLPTRVCFYVNSAYILLSANISSASPQVASALHVSFVRVHLDACKFV